MESSPDVTWLRISTLEHYAYCPRQASLLLDGVWADNRLTVQGDAGHARVDEAPIRHRRGLRVHHHVELASEALQIYGIADAVEELPSGELIPVEHKRGRGAGDLFPSIVQATAQALCLEEVTGRRARHVAVYITSERRREVFEVSEYRQVIAELVAEARAVLAYPVEAKYSGRLCKSCSVRNACQPSGAEWA